MIDLPKLAWAEFTRFWNFIQMPHALFYIGVAVALFVLLLLVALRLIRWLEHSSSWLAGLVRLLGGLLFAALGLIAVPTCLFGLAVWFGSREADPQFTDTISATFASVLEAALWGAGVGLVLGIAAVFYLTRHTIPRFVSWLDRSTRKTGGDQLTDARTVAQLLPKPIAHDPRQHFASCMQRGELYLGIKQDIRPVTMAVKTVCQTHFQLVGPTRTGKGQLAQSLLVQMVRRRQAVVVMDPKIGGDKWLASVLEAECRAAGTPFRYLNLCEGVSQFNPLRNCIQRDTMQLLITSLKLGRKGEAADFYKTAERALAKRVTQGDPNRSWTLPELADALREEAGNDASKFQGLLDLMDELADIPAVQTAEGIDLEDVLIRGGVLYIAGSDADEDIKMLQPMIVQRLVQLIRKREPDSGLQVTMFLDEVKYLLSTAVLNSLGTIADRNCNLILAHQSLKELVCIDADRATTEGIVNTNCTVKFCFRQTDPETVDWIEAQTGKILINVESSEIARNAALSEVQHETRRVQQVQRATIDANMINQLPAGCAVLIGVGMAQLVFSAPLLVQRKNFTPMAAPRLARRRAGDLLREDDKPGSTGTAGMSQ